MNNQKEWISAAGIGVEEERRRLNENGPSLGRYRKAWLDEKRFAFAAQMERHARPLAKITVGSQTEEANVEAEQNNGEDFEA
ncbi:hypothetical protein [Ruegeria atlantica]|uniref:Uncharacterized protein n=1 Tax=Ruegeria atlantica TaxID=81569 RepID=A0A0P1E7V3_9RHOB|nr:hypothetical protein [Ruegeria atlantica]CUH45109.1 hypothetical protein RUM4293_04019 [Ruegeria atlantica]